MTMSHRTEWSENGNKERLVARVREGRPHLIRGLDDITHAVDGACISACGQNRDALAHCEATLGPELGALGASCAGIPSCAARS